MQALVKFVVWLLLVAKLWGEHGSGEETFKVNLGALSAALHAWYGRRHRSYRQEGLARIHALTTEHLGDPAHGSRKPSTKGAETYGLLLFCIYVLEAHRGRLSAVAAPLVEACRCMARIVELFKVPPANFARNLLQEAFDCLNACYARTKYIVDDMDTGKRHLCVHLLKDTLWLGNLDIYANWYDDSLNKMFKAYLKQVSQSTFEPFVLLRMRDGLKLEAQRYDARKRKRDN